MHTTRSSYLFFAAVCLLGAPLSRANSGATLSIPGSHAIAAAAPVTSARGVAGWDSSPWAPVAAVGLALAASPFIRRYMAR